MKIFCPICRKIFWLFLAKKVDFWIKIAIFIAYKTRRVPFGYQNRVRARSGFSLNSRVRGRAGFEKSGFGYLVGFRVPVASLLAGSVLRIFFSSNSAFEYRKVSNIVKIKIWLGLWIVIFISFNLLHTHFHI